MQIIIPKYPLIPFYINHSKLFSVWTKYDINYELHDAVCRRDLPRVKGLINDGADINSVSKHGFSALTNAVLNEDIEMTTYLISAGIDVNYLDEEGKTSLMYAI